MTSKDDTSIYFMALFQRLNEKIQIRDYEAHNKLIINGSISISIRIRISVSISISTSIRIRIGIRIRIRIRISVSIS